MPRGGGERKRPNLVFVFGDQLRYDACGYTGNDKARTPNLDALAKQGTSFCNAVSSSPVCAPFRASLMTGKYTTSTGMVINELRLSPEHDCIGHVLTRGGYQTGYIGKWHLWANQLGNHLDPRNGFVPPGPYRLGFDGYWAGYNFNHQYYRAYYFEDEPKRIEIDGYEPDTQTDLAISFLERTSRKADPFALFLSYGTPHDPWGRPNVPKDYARQFEGVEFPNPANYKPQNDPYARYRVDGKELLFDHVKDPYQMRNLIDDARHADTAERFRTMLKRRMAELNDTFETCTWYRDHWVKDRVILRGAGGGSHDLRRMNAILRRWWGSKAKTVEPTA